MSSATEVAPPGIFPPPPGVTPNYVNPVQREAGLIPLICIFLPLSTIILAIRLYTKARIIKIFGWEDVIITVGWACNVSFMALLIKSWVYGTYGIHTWNMTITKFPLWNKLATAGILLFVPAVALPKIAILHFYLRINPSRSFHYSVYTTMFITWGYMIGIMLALLFPCKPVAKLWDPFKAGHCINQTPIYIALPILNTVVDLLLLFLPIPMLIKLQVDKRTKSLLAGLFVICSSTVVIAAARIWAITWILGSSDDNWESSMANSLTVTEASLTVICGSVMVLRPFCRRRLPWLMGRSTGHDDGPSHSTPLSNFDGPLGPRSKSGYRAKVSTGGYMGPKGSKGSGRRNLFGSTLVKDDQDDLEGLSAELHDIAPHVTGKKATAGLHKEMGGSPKAGTWLDDVDVPSEREIGVARTTTPEVENHQLREPPDLERGIVKTVSLEVR